MEAKSNIKPLERFKIENIKNGHCTVFFFANIIEQEEKDEIMYSYDMYVIETFYRKNLQEDIENNYNTWLDFAKQQEYDKLALEIRDKRNKLLEETDKEMCLDRLDLKLPSELSANTLLVGMKQFFNTFSEIFNGKIVKYRQELRNITKQEGFPYNVIWPTKDEEE